MQSSISARTKKIQLKLKALQFSQDFSHYKSMGIFPDAQGQLTLQSMFGSGQRTSFHKGVFLGPEYLNNILGTNGHIKETCIAANFESNGPLVWCLLCIKSGWGNSIPVLPEVIN